MINCNTNNADCQKVLQNLQIKKAQNHKVMDWLASKGDSDRAAKIYACGTQVGITLYHGFAKIVRGNFCRDRLCNVCAWRRQAKFFAQMLPVVSVLSNECEFVFITLTIQNCAIGDVNKTVNDILLGYTKLARQARFKRAFKGVIKSLEITYKADDNTYHPHIHLLCCVDKSYFRTPDYIKQWELTEMWRKAMLLTYNPRVDIRRVDDECKAALEVIKYTLKPNQCAEVLQVFYSTLKNRRLVSFSGRFAEIRKDLKLSDFDTDLLDDVDTQYRKTFDLYEFDVTGGVYKFYKTYEV